MSTEQQRRAEDLLFSESARVVLVLLTTLVHQTTN